MNHHSYLLELSSISHFRPKTFPEPDILIIQANVNDAGLCKRLWDEVGQGFWSERKDWALERWRNYLNDIAVSFWIAKKNIEKLDSSNKIEIIRQIAPQKCNLILC
jgi:hypothetical protein